jgi:transcriptional regulator
MSTDSKLKYQRENIELRRGKVLELLTKGHTQSDIAKALNCSPALISLDIQWIKEKSKKELETHLSDRLPFEYARAMEGINNVLKRVSEISDSAADNKIKMECLKLQMELYKSLVSMATDGGIIERAMKMVRVISPLQGEDIPAESQEEKEQQHNDGEDIIIEEEEPTSTEQDEQIEEE